MAVVTSGSVKSSMSQRDAFGKKMKNRINEAATIMINQFNSEGIEYE